MKKLYQGSLLFDYGVDELHFVVLKSLRSVSVYSPKMELLRQTDSLPFEPSGFLAVSSKEMLFFNHENQICHLDIEDGQITKIDPPVGTSSNKSISASTIFKNDDGIVFFPGHSGVRMTSFLYLIKEKKFRRKNIKLPERFSTYNAGEHGALYCLNEKGDLDVCSFKKAYESKAFVPEMTIKRELLEGYVNLHDIFCFSCGLAHLSIQKGVLVVIKEEVAKDLSSFESIKNHMLHHSSGSVSLISKEGYRKTIKLDGFVHIDTHRFSDSVAYIYHGLSLDLYSTDDLTLLGTFPLDLGLRMVLPDGRAVFEIKGNVYVSDRLPFSVALKALEKKKQH